MSHFRFQFSPRCLLTLFLALISVSLEPARAQVASWAAPVSGFYETGANWDPFGVPAFNDTVVFGKAGSYDVGFQGAVGAENLGVANDADVDFVVAGASSSPRLLRLTGDGSIDDARLRLLGSVDGPRLSVVMDGDLDLFGGPNTLQIVNHAVLLNQSTTVDVNGTIPVTGDLARWSMSGDLLLGGSGLVSVTDGGAVAVQRSLIAGSEDPDNADDGFLSVIGVGADQEASTLTVGGDMILGSYGAGRLTVKDGGFADVTDRVQVALGSGSSGEIVVEGVDAAGNPATLNTGLLTLGRGGSASFRINAGGLVESDSVTVSSDSSAAAAVSGGDEPAVWRVTGGLRIGGSFSGIVDVDDGGRLESTRVFLGLGAGTGRLFVQGGAAGTPTTSWQNSEDVYVGGNEATPLGPAFAIINGDARADVAGLIRIWADGSVDVRNGARLAADTIDHTHGGEFKLADQSVLHVNRFEGDLSNTEGIVAPGVDDDAGSTLVLGDYTQGPDATLSIGVGGTSPGGTHDLVNIVGDANVDGLLELRLIDGFTPEADDVFTVLAADSLIGFFDNAATGGRLDTSDGLGSFVVNYGIGSAFDEDRIVLSDFIANVLPLPGDFNADGVVDNGDLSLLLGNWGAASVPASWTSGFTSPVDNSELNALLTGWGQSLSSAVAVPEPSAFVASALAIAGLWRRVDRR